MAVELTDKEINGLISEKKVLPDNYRKKLKNYRSKRGHYQSELEIKGDKGSSFYIMIRLNQINKLDFSAILAYEMPKKQKRFLLKRYNGKHFHRNTLEKEDLYDFHVHEAT
ncbi:MAG: hypothetical protein ABIE07_09810 [Candidatus Zixiibacteriota bacterium]